jgi:acyl-CoA synthetase (NDP forming)
MNKPLVADIQERPEKVEAVMAPGLNPFFAPKSVAVIGASPKEGNQGRRIMESLKAHGFSGRVVAVHPRGEPISPYPVVRSVAELPGDLDLAIAAVPARNVPGLVEPLAERGIRHLIVISAGFAETGLEGQILERQLREAGKRFGVRIMGPNCMGVLSPPECFNSFFLSPEEFAFPPPGPVALISQSGALMSLALDRLARLNLGVHRAVNIGNRADVGECELLEAFESDPAVRVIGLYLEGVQDGRRFVETAARVSQTKPVVIWKGGHGSRGGDAAQAHSASLAGSYEVFQAACAKADLIEAFGLEEFLQALEVFSLQPPLKGKRILIISNGGGVGVFLTDLCEKQGLKVPEPSTHAQEELRRMLPGYYSFKNPVDLTGSGTNRQCAEVVEKLLATGDYDGLLLVPLLGTAGITTEIASLIHDHVPKHLPVVAGTYGRTRVPQMSEEFKKYGIPVFHTAEAAARALKFLGQWGEQLHKPDHEQEFTETFYHCESANGWPAWHGGHPHEMEIKNFLRNCGVRVPRNHHINERQDLENAVFKWGFPMTLKAAGADIRHKTEIGGVRIDLGTLEELTEAWEEMSSHWPGMVWAEDQMPPGLDLMVGAHRDPQFGPVLVFGSGGRHVEIFKDVGRALLPAGRDELLKMIHQTRAGKIIAGTRGLPPLALSHLVDFLRLIGGWMLDEGRIESMDFNPVRLYEFELVVLDAKITASANPEGR